MANLKGAEKQQYVANLFTRIAGRYDLMNDMMTARLHRRWKGQTAQLTAKGIKGKALDIATGTGDLALALSRCQGISHTVGVDLLSEMVVLGLNKAQANGQACHITMLQGDALRLPFPESSFACATAGFSLRNMPDLSRALAEMVRVVRPGGRVTTLELTPQAAGIGSWFIRWYFHRVVPRLGQIVAGNREAYTYLPDSVEVFPSADRLAELFSEAGLVNVGYRHLGFGTIALHWGHLPPD